MAATSPLPTDYLLHRLHLPFCNQLRGKQSMWFEKLTGFEERSGSQVRENLQLVGERLISRVNGRVMQCGRLERPSLAELRQQAAIEPPAAAPTIVREEVADVTRLHRDQTNRNALFQIASQFNLLEMLSPRVTPEHGVDGYETDPTQGPACAVAAGAGTLFRNYFAPIDDAIGQTADKQIDCLADLGAALGNRDNRLWTMQNGYALATESGLKEIAERLTSASQRELDRLRGLLRIGVQWNTEVTISDTHHTVSQAYCSALPVAYPRHSPSMWEPFARLILEAAYEATLACAQINHRTTGNNRVYLTLLGGGAFGNQLDWILDAIRRALVIHRNTGLEVVLVSRGHSNPALVELIERSRSAPLAGSEGVSPP
jgi:hypothetical protein